MSYIKRETLLQKAKELLRDDAFGAARIVREIERAPAEDVVEVNLLNLSLRLQHDKSLENLKEYLQENDIVKVTRCKDCRWWHSNGCAFRRDCTDLPSDDDFCSHGERRINNE